MLDILVLLAGALVVGAPIVIWVHRWERVNPMRLAALAASVGVLAVALIAIVLVRVGAYTPVTLLVVVAVSGLLTWAWVIARAGMPSLAIGWSAGPFLILVPVVLFLRERPVYFVFAIGDMGEYINLANSLNATGQLVESFPHLFTTALAFAGALVGASNLIYLLPVVGLSFWGLSTLLVDEIGGRASAWVVSAVLAVHMIPTWFSQFPVSESLYAMALMLTLYLIKVAVDTGDRRIAFAAGLMPGVLLLLRGNAVLLLPILLVVVAMTALGSSEKTYRSLRYVYVVSLASLAVGYFYNVTWLRSYFFESQITGLAEGFAGVLRTLALDRVSLGGLVVASAVAGTSVWLVDRLHLSHTARAARHMAAHAFVWVGPLSFAGLALLVTSPTGSGLADAGGRFGVLLLLLAMVGLFLGGGWPASDGTRIVIALSSILVAVFSLLFTIRIGSPRGHAFFLYWDRYLFSEAFPSVVVLAGVGLSRLLGLARLSIGRIGLAGGLSVLTIGIAAIGVGPALTIREQPMFVNSYQEVSSLNTLALSEGEGPILFSGYLQQPDGWIFPNSYRAIATPLVFSFSRSVPNIIGLDPFESDPIVSMRDAYEFLDASGLDQVYLIRAVGPGSGSTAESEEGDWAVVGEVAVPIEVVPQVPGVLHPEMHLVHMAFEVVLVSGLDRR